MTIAVIGHGRSPEGQRWGSRIDACHTVIRMWDYWPWQRACDYGEKYSYGLFVLTPKGLQVFTQHNQQTPSKGWLAYLGKPTSGKLPNHVPVEVIDPTSWVEQGQAMGGVGLSGKLTLTRGCVAAAWAICLAPYADKVVLVGFDNVLAMTNRPIEESFCPEYWRMFNGRFDNKLDKAYPTGQPKTETHDMNIELPLLQKLARERGIPLEFAQEVWK